MKKGWVTISVPILAGFLLNSVSLVAAHECLEGFRSVRSFGGFHRPEFAGRLAMFNRLRLCECKQAQIYCVFDGNYAKIVQPVVHYTLYSTTSFGMRMIRNADFRLS